MLTINALFRNQKKFLLALIVLIGTISYLRNDYRVKSFFLNWKSYNKPTENDTILKGYDTNLNISENIPTESAINSKVTDDTVLKFGSKSKLPNSLGRVNIHVWHNICITTIDGLRQNPLFPLWPNVRRQPEMANELVLTLESKFSVQRVMGLLFPSVSGDYRFEISSLTVSEFWLSTNEDPGKSVLMARNNKNILHGINFAKGPLIPKSKQVPLERGRAYYFEVIHGINNLARDQVQIRWMLPGGAKIFTGIPNSSLSTIVLNDTSLDMQTRDLVLRSPSLLLQETTLQKPKKHKWANVSFSKPFKAYPSYTRENLHTLKFANNTKIMSAFKECDYAPSYTRRRDYGKYQGHWNTHFNDVFPYDDTDQKIWQGQFVNTDMHGNTLIAERDVIVVVELFMATLEATIPGEYKLADIVNVERNVDKKRGNRFFLELVLLEINTKELQQLSEYVYQFKNNSTVCKPKGFKWSPTVKINAVITAKGQGPWIVHYIKNVAQVLHVTRDSNVHLIIVDFGNNGVDVEEELKRNGVNSFTVIKKTGKFHKTLAIDEAAKSVQDDNSIVFLTDLHLDIPNNIFESVRKHTFQGLVAYTPVLFRLVHCGRPASDQSTTTGHWETWGFGIISTYKSDWKSFGGVNVKDFKHKWGGEDWEMVDRVLNKGIEIERLRLPYFYHFYHNKKGMWDQA